MRFPIPSPGVNACAVLWRPPPESSPRVKDVTIKGEVTELEVWQLISLSATSTALSSKMDELDYETLSYSNIPVRGELLGVLNLTSSPNSTTVEFSCPSDAENLTVELRCQRVGCHISFMQVDMVPKLRFELIRRK